MVLGSIKDHYHGITGLKSFHNTSTTFGLKLFDIKTAYCPHDTFPQSPAGSIEVAKCSHETRVRFQAETLGSEKKIKLWNVNLF